MPTIGMRDPCSHISRHDIIAARLSGNSNSSIHDEVAAHLRECPDVKPVWDLPSIPEYQ